MPAQLLALSEGPSILLDKPILLIGRHPECDLQLDSRKISRRHCCIAQVSDYLVVRDLGSTNGIRINGVRVLEGRLRAGDEVTIGGHRYLVSWEGVPAPQAPAKPERPVPHVRADEDALLEACDEPVPLVDPADSLPLEPAAPPPPAAIPCPDSPSPAKGKDLGPPSIPEGLELASPSDSERPPRPLS
jgi:predicted component of type VI protein secretion system